MKQLSFVPFVKMVYNGCGSGAAREPRRKQEAYR
jgi:hypothetical protein